MDHQTWILGSEEILKLNKATVFSNFSFIFKDDKPIIDHEVINNPQEPMRIEEKVRYVIFSFKLIS